MPCGTPRSRPSCGTLQPDLEIDWLAQDPVTAVLEDARRADPSAQRGAGLRIRPHRLRVDGARAQRLPGDPPHGRDPRQQLHGLPRRDRRGRIRPRHRRRGVGRRLLPAREPGAEADGLRVADRLRRLAADARRRRSRGIPDRRLQRRDDRADRALPADPGPGDLRRRSRRHRSGRLRAGPAVDPGVDRGPLRVRRLRDRVRPLPAPRATRGAARRSWGTGRTSGWWWSPWVGQGSARPCCGG